jgi:ribosome-binding protein aMBF1 (putative translation factor)
MMRFYQIYTVNVKFPFGLKREALHVQNIDLKSLFARNRKAWRKNRGISPKTRSERYPAAPTAIRQIESGSRTPPFAFIVKLAEALTG